MKDDLMIEVFILNRSICIDNNWFISMNRLTIF
jgi:hypothetical protein